MTRIDFIWTRGTLQNKKKVEQLTEQQQFDIRLAFQSHEIEEHKYFLSEQKGFDVGIEESLASWVNSGQAERFSHDFSKNEESIYHACVTNCDDKKCYDSCWLSVNQVHDLLDDAI
ncbi:MAG: hypothetical protein GXP21_07445 [Gammaproteobacteria bacterium]|nr:hypothetical protein [Gammaproteobacteria bacterium]